MYNESDRISSIVGLKYISTEQDLCQKPYFDWSSKRVLEQKFNNFLFSVWVIFSCNLSL